MIFGKKENVVKCGTGRFMVLKRSQSIIDLLMCGREDANYVPHCYIPEYPRVRMYRGVKVSEGVYRCNVQSEHEPVRVVYSAFGTKCERPVRETLSSFCIVTVRKHDILLEEDLWADL